MTLRAWSPARSEAHDRRNAAIHEAGHARRTIWNTRTPGGTRTIMSATDWNMAMRNPGEPSAAFMRAVIKVIGLLSGPLRAELYVTARGLIVESRDVGQLVA